MASKVENVSSRRESDGLNGLDLTLEQVEALENSRPEYEKVLGRKMTLQEVYDLEK